MEIQTKSYLCRIHTSIILGIREGLLHNTEQTIITALSVELRSNLPQPMELVERYGGKVVMLDVIVGAQGVQRIEPAGIRRRAGDAIASRLVDGAAVVGNEHGRCRMRGDAPKQLG